MGAVTDTGPVWLVQRLPEDRAYRFINLQDNAAWRVAIRGGNGFTVAIPGHVSYGHGSFSSSLEPGSYWLTWDNTVAMLEPRADEAPRPKLQSAFFVVPQQDSASFELARARS